jgi:hypothetical protein
MVNHVPTTVALRFYGHQFTSNAVVIGGVASVHIDEAHMCEFTPRHRELRPSARGQ